MPPNIPAHNQAEENDYCHDDGNVGNPIQIFHSISKADHPQESAS
jgi:hypothetical protein